MSADDQGLTDGTGESILDRIHVRRLYAAALDGTFDVAVSREGAIEAMTDAVMNARDRELRVLRQRLAMGCLREGNEVSDEVSDEAGRT